MVEGDINIAHGKANNQIRSNATSLWTGTAACQLELRSRERVSVKAAQPADWWSDLRAQ